MTVPSLFQRPASADALLAAEAARTILWLHGRRRRLYGYLGRPAAETLELIVPLEVLNQIPGVITIGSQPGRLTPTHQQRAFVDLLALPSPARSLTAQAREAGMVVRCYPAVRHPTREELRHGKRAPVTRIQQPTGRRRDRTWAGVPTAESAFPRRHWPVLEDAGLVALTIFDPQWGRREALWEALLPRSGPALVGRDRTASARSDVVAQDCVSAAEREGRTGSSTP